MIKLYPSMQNNSNVHDLDIRSWSLANGNWQVAPVNFSLLKNQWYILFPLYLGIQIDFKYFIFFPLILSYFLNKCFYFILNIKKLLDIAFVFASFSKYIIYYFWNFTWWGWIPKIFRKMLLKIILKFRLRLFGLT